MCFQQNPIILTYKYSITNKVNCTSVKTERKILVVNLSLAF